MNMRTSALVPPLLALIGLLALAATGASQLEPAALESDAVYDDIQWNEYEAFRDIHADTDVAWELLLAALEPGAGTEPLQRPEDGWLLVDDTWVLAEELPYRSSLWSRVRVRVGGMTTTDQWSRAEGLLNSVAALLEERLAYEAWLLEQESQAVGGDPVAWAAAQPAVYLLGGGSYYGSCYDRYWGPYWSSFWGPYCGWPYVPCDSYWWADCDNSCGNDCQHWWNDHGSGDNDGEGDETDPGPDPDAGGLPDLVPRPRTVRMTDLARRVADIRSAPRGTGVPIRRDGTVTRAVPVRRGSPGPRTRGGSTPTSSRPSTSRVPGIVVTTPSSQPRTSALLRRTQPSSRLRTRVVRSSPRSRLTLPTRQRTSSSKWGLSLTSQLRSGPTSRATGSSSSLGRVRTASSALRTNRGIGRTGSRRTGRGSTRGVGSTAGSSKSAGRAGSSLGGRSSGIR